MNEPAQVVCASCQAIVRVPAPRLADQPRCPRCHEALFQGEPFALTTATFDQHLTRNDLPLVVDIWAPWCGPCQAMAPQFKLAAARMEPYVRFAKVNSDEEPALSARFGIRSIPTLLVFQGGKEIARKSGAMDAGSLQRWVQQVTQVTQATAG